MAETKDTDAVRLKLSEADALEFLRDVAKRFPKVAPALDRASANELLAVATYLLGAIYLFDGRLLTLVEDLIALFVKVQADMLEEFFRLHPERRGSGPMLLCPHLLENETYGADAPSKVTVH